MQSVRLQVDEGVAVLTLDNPPANALSGAVLSRLRAAVEELGARDDVRAIVATSVGMVSFMSGADVKELPGLLQSPSSFEDRTRIVAEIFELVAQLPQPIVAAVQASAVGGGLEFMLLCDFAVTCPESRFGLPEVALGLIPGAGGTQRLTRRVPLQVAREMMFLGRMLDGNEAMANGLVNRVVPRAEVLSSGLELARRLATAPRVAVQELKAVIRDGDGSALDVGIELERAAFLRVANSHDAGEGTRAFLERRKPAFQHQ